MATHIIQYGNQEGCRLLPPVSPLGPRIFEVSQDWSPWCQYNVTGGASRKSVWDLIPQRGSTLTVSIVFPVTTRHRRDMTDNVESDVKPKQTNLLQKHRS